MPRRSPPIALSRYRAERRRTSPAVDGLTIAGGNSVVKGLDIGGFDGAAMALTTNGGDVVEGNYIGTDATETSAVPHQGSKCHGDGVFVTSSNDIIGGTARPAT